MLPSWDVEKDVYRFPGILHQHLLNMVNSDANTASIFKIEE
jgi:hypothetical protein